MTQGAMSVAIQMDKKIDIIKNKKAAGSLFPAATLTAYAIMFVSACCSGKGLYVEVVVFVV